MKNLFICPKSITLYLDGDVYNTVPLGAILSIGEGKISLYSGNALSIRCKFEGCWDRIDFICLDDNNNKYAKKRPSSYKYLAGNSTQCMAFTIDGKEVPQSKYDEFKVHTEKMQDLYIKKTVENLRKKLNMYYDKINC